MNKPSQSFIQSLARGLTVLQAFSSESPRLTLTALSQKTGIKIAALQRYTATLMDLGFLKRNKHREFFLGPKVLSLGFSFMNASQVRKQAEALINEFSEKVNKTMNMAVLDQGYIFFIYRKEAQQFLNLDLRTGSRLPAHCTASGKLLLSAQEDSYLADLIQSMEKPKLTEATITDPEELFSDLMKTRSRGFSISNRELYLDLYSVAMPILDQDQKVVASVNISISVREAHTPAAQAVLDQFTDLGRTLCGLLGYTGDYPRVFVNPGSGEGF
jgi:IclR family pca regulon transcriptional regulator